MELAPPKVVSAQGVIGLALAIPSSADIDEQLVRALQPDFPNVIVRQPPLASAPSEGPRLVLSSTSSQLVISPAQADFQVRFYGDFTSDAARSLAYAQKKMEGIRRAFAEAGLQPANLGFVVQMQFSFEGIETRPVDHILATHLRVAVDPAIVRDTVARVAVNVRDKYFVMFRVADYETRMIQRPVMPGDRQIVIRPWEGSLEDEGVSLTIDINNTLEAMTHQGDVTISEQGVVAVMDLMRQSMSEAGPRFAETGELKVESLVKEPA
jgi:hypothetical protein